MSILAKITTGKLSRPQKVTIYGVESVGKTSLIKDAPGLLVLDVEDGSTHLDVPRLRIRSWKELLSAVRDLLNEDHSYRTLVLDSVDWTEKLGAEALLAQHNADSIEEIGGGFSKGWTKLGEKMGNLLTGLDRLVDERGMSVCLIGHSKVTKYEPPDGMASWDRFELRLCKTVHPLVKEWSDSILFYNFRTRVVETKNKKAKGIGSERVIHTVRSAAYDAKCRPEGIPEEILIPDKEEAGSLFSLVAPIFGLNGSGNGSKAISPEPQVNGRSPVAPPVPLPRPPAPAPAPPVQDPAPADSSEFEAPENTAYAREFEAPERKLPIIDLVSGDVPEGDLETFILDVESFLKARAVIEDFEGAASVSEDYLARVKRNPKGWLSAFSSWNNARKAAEEAA